MPAAPTSRVPALDGLRGLAVLLVFFYHYAGGARSSNWGLRAVGEVNKAGWSGVTLFFVLSGFLITGILWDSFAAPHKDQHWLRNFYARRALRILPLYYAALLLALIGALIAGSLAPALRSIWIPALFLQNFPVLAQRVQPFPSPLILNHLWTLAVEEQFYLVWPALLWLQKTRRGALRLCAITFFASIAFRAGFCAFAPQHSDCTDLLFARAGELAAGGWLALAVRGAQWDRVQSWASAAFSTALLTFGLVSWRQGTANLTGALQLTLGLAATAVGFAALLAMALRPGFVQRAMSAAWLRWLGKLSFGIYVFHILLRPLYWHITHRIVPESSGSAYFVTRFAVAAMATLAVSWLSFHFYERPFLRLKSRFRSLPNPSIDTVGTH